MKNIVSFMKSKNLGKQIKNVGKTKQTIFTAINAAKGAKQNQQTKDKTPDKAKLTPKGAIKSPRERVKSPKNGERKEALK